MKSRSWVVWLVLNLVPIASLVLGHEFLTAKGPFWLGLNADPDYPYLLNSVNIAQGLLPAHADHPGTLIQLMGAAIIRTAHAFAGSGDLAEDVVQQPEHYLFVIEWIFFGLYAVSLMILGRTIWAVTRCTTAAVLAQLTPFLSTTIPTHLACVKPEPVLLVLSALIGVLVMRTFQEETVCSSVGLGVAFGVLCGSALAGKITAGPLLFAPLIALSGRRTIAILLLSTALAVSLLTSPAWPVLDQVLGLAGQIATHTGMYGTGPPSLFEPGPYVAAVFRLLWGERLMAASMVAGVIAMVVDRRQPAGGHPRARRALMAILAAQVGCLLLVARHPFNEYLVAGNHYLIPGLGMTGCALAGAYLLLADRATKRQRVLVMVLVLALAAQQALSLRATYYELRRARDLQLEVSRLAQQRFPGKVIFFYRSSAPAYALHLGNWFAGGRYRQFIATAHPNAIYYSIWTHRFEPAEAVQPPPLDHGPVVFAMQGSPLHGSQIMEIPVAIRPTLQYQNQREALYELRIPAERD
jgi:hypothetical protein